MQNCWINWDEVDALIETKLMPTKVLINANYPALKGHNQWAGGTVDKLWSC